MSDLISRQTAIDAVDEYLDGKFISCSGKQMSILIGCVINQLPSAEPERKTARWIPVTERLPEIDEGVLVSDGEWVWKDWLEVRYGKVGWCNSETLKGTAWMPLPEPYKEVEHGC